MSQAAFNERQSNEDKAQPSMISHLEMEKDPIGVKKGAEEVDEDEIVEEELEVADAVPDLELDPVIEEGEEADEDCATVKLIDRINRLRITKMLLNLEKLDNIEGKWEREVGLWL